MMDVPISYLVNFVFAWVIVLLAITGYFLTIKRMGQKWPFWIILATGWAFFAIAYTLLISGVQAGAPYLVAIWLSSYILVIASLVVLFLKLSTMKKHT